VDPTLGVTKEADITTILRNRLSKNGTTRKRSNSFEEEQLLPDVTNDGSEGGITNDLRRTLAVEGMKRTVQSSVIAAVAVAEDLRAQAEDLRAKATACALRKWEWMNEEHKALLLKAQTIMAQLQRSGAPEERIQSILQQIHSFVESRGAIRYVAQLTQLTQFVALC
jgi:hypothetical protein